MANTKSRDYNQMLQDTQRNHTLSARQRQSRIQQIRRAMAQESDRLAYEANPTPRGDTAAQARRKVSQSTEAQRDAAAQKRIDARTPRGEQRDDALTKQIDRIWEKL